LSKNVTTSIASGKLNPADTKHDFNKMADAPGTFNKISAAQEPLEIGKNYHTK
jgi:hypothetical protein